MNPEKKRAYFLRMLVRAYQRIVSPHLGPVCRFLPSCSDYAQEALAEQGVLRGGFKVLARILRCHPFHAGGYDPVSK